MKILNTYKTILFLFVVASTFFSCAQKETPKKPNFLFVLVDDQPFDALESSGRYPFLKTPNMQRLEDEGAIFENYYVTTYSIRLFIMCCWYFSRINICFPFMDYR